MNWGLIAAAVAVMAGSGLLLGVMLAVAAVKFHVEVDPRVEKIRGALPGTNCGACGWPGCDAAAEAIAVGKAPYNACVAGGHTTAEAVAAVLGIEHAAKGEPIVTVVRCRGGRDRATTRFAYQGVDSCLAANITAGGPLACSYGCLGFGDCFRACPFNAITMAEDGLPIIDLEICTRCGICINACPRKIIAFLPAKAEVVVFCVNKDLGKYVRAACSVGCIACKACERVCEPKAIVVTDNLAVIDYQKCNSCGKCIEKCPPHCLVWRIPVMEPSPEKA